MRIRRRPQAQQQSQPPPPYPLPPEQQPSDPFAAPRPPPPPPPNAEEQHWELPLPGDEAEQGKKRRIESEEGLHSHSRRPDADPAVPAATRPALPSRPQGGGNVVGRSSSSAGDDDRPGHGRHGGGGGGAQRQGAPAAAGGHARTHESLENGHRRGESERPVISAGERLIVPAMPAVPVSGKEGIKDDRGGGTKKKRRGPPVLMEGSRCSRVNGRGWRCSQPTLVGYSLCEHHLGKGRQKSASRTEPSSWKNGGATLGRTEPSISRKKAPQPSMPVVAAAPTANGRVAAPKLGRTDPASGRKNADALAAAAHDASDLSSLRAATLAAEVD